MKVNTQNLNQLAWEKQERLLPAIIQDAYSGSLLMLAYMTPESLQQTLETGQVTFYSRSRQIIWCKGETSGNTLQCVEVTADCDRDTLKVLAIPAGPVCHLGTATCWAGSGEPALAFLARLESVIHARRAVSTKDSYTSRLFDRGRKHIAQKVGEEAVETVIAAVVNDKQEFLEESADLIFHLLVLVDEMDLSFKDVIGVLRSRHPGDK